jgi:hypothetical protein
LKYCKQIKRQENEEIYYDLEKVEEVPYFSTLIFKKGGFYE